MSSMISPRKVKRVLQKLATCFLLVVYLVAVSEIAHLHTHSHEHEIAHDLREELDPCHLAIHHHDSKNGCHHQSHLVASDDNCDLCHYLAFHKDQFTAATATKLNISFARAEVSVTLVVGTSRDSIVLSSRAPPSMLI